MNRIGILIGVVVLLGLAVFLLTREPAPEREKNWPALDGQIVPAIINGQELQLEVAASPASITQGLSGRNSIGADGLIFVFAEPQQQHFWMKEMKFALDIVWIQDDTVQQVTADVPFPDPLIPLFELPTYSPDSPVNMVLEVPAGKAAEWQVIPGTKIEWK
ncbi:MAG: DUF192 domain-containing protein [bacterium]|nr:DUF192 domain-containing protein [bacterium]